MNKELKYLRFILISIIFGFTILFGSSLFWNIKNEFMIAHEYSLIESTASFNKDILYRRWVAMHGGVYVPVTDTTPPNPNLKHIPERDITTPSGKKLTLINPAYMTRQVFELAQNQYGVKGHITSLDPIRPANKADEWESEALKMFAKGEEEYHSTEIINNIEYLRYMHVMKVEESCLKCHAQQGYKIGDIRGGISVSVPMDKYKSIVASKIRFSGITHVIIYLIFIFFSILAYFKFFKEFKTRNQIQQKLIKSEEFYRLINNTTFDQIYSYDLENRFTSANKTLCENLKLSEDDIIGKTYWELGFPEENCRTRDEWHRKTYENGVNMQISETAMPDGTTQYFEVNLFVLKDSEGTAIGLAGVNRNITESKLAEQEIIKAKEKAEENEKKYRQLYESNQMPISIFDIETLKFLSVNNAFVEKYGYTREEFLKMTILDIRPESEFGNLEHSVKSEEDKGLENKGVWLHRKKNGEIIQVEIIRYDLVFEGKNAKLVFANDISQLKQSEIKLIAAKEKVEESEKKFKATFYTSPDSVSISKLNGEYVEINESFTRISGYTETEVLGKTSSEINIWAVPEDRKKIVATLKKNDYIENFESLFRAKNKSYLIIST